jgi:ABC-type Zn2+ transport system substrate-binding protein/surface adhesin
MADADDQVHPQPAADAGHDDLTGHGHDAHEDDGHGSGDDHGHGGPAEPLGPVDARAWAAAIGGSLLAIVVVVALYLAIAG